MSQVFGIKARSQLKEIANINDFSTIIFGDSITYQNYSGRTDKPNDYYARGFFDVGNVMCGHMFNCIYNAGHSGLRTDQLLPYLQADVLDRKSRFVHVLAGTNDVDQNINPNATIINIKAICDSILSKNKILIIGTIPARTTASAFQLQALTKINNWIKDYAVNNNNIIVVDYYAYMADGTTGLAKTDINIADGIHPSIKGAWYMGTAFKNAMNKAYNLTPLFSGFSNVDSKNLLLNSTFKDGTTVATNWTASGGVGTDNVFSLESPTDYIDNKYQTIQMSNIATTATLTQNVTTGFAVGQTVTASLEFVSELTSIKELRLYITFTGGNNTANDLYVEPGYMLQFSALPANGILKTKPFVIPSGTTALQFTIEVSGVGKIKFRNPKLAVIDQISDIQKSNLVANGDFTYASAGWTYGGSDGWDFSGGTAKLTASATFKTAYQFVFAVKPNTQYTFSCTLSGGDVYVSVDACTSAFVKISTLVISRGGSTVITTPANTNNIKITLSNGSTVGTAVTFDNISLIEV